MAGGAAQSCPLLVEAVLAALAVAPLCVSLTVDTVQAPGVPKAVRGPPIAGATQCCCKRRQSMYSEWNGTVCLQTKSELFFS